MAFSSGLGKAVISMSVDGAAASKKAIESVADSVRGVKLSLTDLAQLSVAGISIGAFAGMIKGAVDAADTLGDLSKSTGVAIADLAGLKMASEQSGANLEAVAKSLNKLSLEMSKNGDKFAALGITAKEPIEAFKQLADVFAAVEDPQTRAALGTMALGKSWAEVAPLLAEGSDRIGAMIDSGRKLSGVTDELVARADEFNDRMAEMSTAIEGAKMRLASDMVPALTDVTNAVMKAYEESGKLNALWVGMGALGAFLFTDEFSSAEVKIGNLRTELAQLQQDLSLSKNAPYVGFVGRMLWGESTESLEADVARVKGQIESLKKSMEPPTVAFADTFGADFMKRVDAYRVNSVLGDKEDAAKREAAARKATDEARRQADAYTALTSAINARVAETARAAAGLKPLNEAEKLQLDLTERLTTGKLKLTPVQKAEYESRVRQLAANLELIDTQRVSNEVHEATAKLYREMNSAAVKSIEDATEEAEKNEELARTYGMTAAAVAQLEVARLEEQLAQRSSLGLTLDEIEVLEKLIDAKRRSAAALSSVEGQETRRQANEAMNADWSRSVDKYNDIFREGFADMLNKGKDGWKSFTRSLATTFRTSVADQLYKMFAQPFVMRLVASLIGVTGGSTLSTVANAATGQGGFGDVASLGSAASSAYSAISAGFEGIATTVADTVQATMYQSGMTTQIASNGSFATGAGTAAGYAAGAAVGVYGGRAVSNGYSAIGSGSGNTAVNVGTAIGAIWGPIGMAIGGLIGGLVNRAFGRKEREVTSTTLKGTFGQNGFTGSTDEAWIEKGGWFRSDRTGTEKTTVDGAVAKQFAAGYDAIKAAAVDFATTLGISADGIKTRTQEMSVALTKDVEANKKAISDFFVDIGNTIAREVLPSVASFGREGEIVSATLQRVAVNYATIDAALGALGKTFGALGVDSIAARERLVDLSGGIDAFAQNAASFAQNFLTVDERSAQALAAVTKQMTALGYASVDTHAEFKALVLGLNPATEAGAKLWAELMKVQGAFAAVHPDITATTNSLTDARSALTEAYEREADAIKATNDRVSAFATSLRGLRNNALLGNLSPLSPQQKLAEARSQFESVILAARNGDEGAQARFNEAYTAFLTASQQVNASGAAYQRDFAYAQSAAADALAWAEQQVDIGRASLTSLNSQVAGLITVNSSVLSVTAAVNALREAMVSVGGTGPADAIDSLYQSLLGRKADAAGLEFWTAQLGKGVPIADISAAIGGSAERAAAPIAPPIMPTINYAAMGTASMAPLATEIKTLRTSNEQLLAEVKLLRADAHEQTVAVIQSAAIGQQASAAKVVEATVATGRLYKQTINARVNIE